MNDSLFGSALASGSSTTTARDLVTLLSYVAAHKHFLINVTLSKDRTFVGEDGLTEFRWENKNPWLLSGDARYRGGVGVVRPDGSGSALLLFALPLAEWSDRVVAISVPESKDIKGDIERIRTFVEAHFVYGIERDPDTFIREKEEPTPSLLYKMKQLLDIQRFLDKKTEYQREV